MPSPNEENQKFLDKLLNSWRNPAIDRVKTNIKTGLEEGLQEHVVNPLHNAGYENLGPAIGAGVMTGADMLLPDTPDTLEVEPPGFSGVMGTLGRKGGKLLSLNKDKSYDDVMDHLLERGDDRGFMKEFSSLSKDEARDWLKGKNKWEIQRIGQIVSDKQPLKPGMKPVIDDIEAAYDDINEKYYEKGPLNDGYDEISAERNNAREMLAANRDDEYAKRMHKHQPRIDKALEREEMGFQERMKKADSERKALEKEERRKKKFPGVLGLVEKPRGDFDLALDELRGIKSQGAPSFSDEAKALSERILPTKPRPKSGFDSDFDDARNLELDQEQAASYKRSREEQLARPKPETGMGYKRVADTIAKGLKGKTDEEFAKLIDQNDWAANRSLQRILIENEKSGDSSRISMLRKKISEQAKEMENSTALSKQAHDNRAQKMLEDMGIVKGPETRNYTELSPREKNDVDYLMDEMDQFPKNSQARFDIGLEIDEIMRKK